MRSMPVGKPLKRGLWRLTKVSSRHGIVARMSIRMVALELYRVMKEIDELEKKLKGLRAGSQEGMETGNRLRQAKAQRDRLKKMIEGAKDD